jgi:primosomal protein N''
VFFLTKIISVLLLIFTTIGFVIAQDDKKTDKPKDKNAAAQTFTAEQLAETVIFFYGTRENMQQIRKSTIERGKVVASNSDGGTDTTNYERRILRGDVIDKDRIRVDQELPNGRFSFVHNEKKIFGLFNETVFNPNPEAVKAFQHQMYHGLDALLRYKENASKLELTGKDKKYGVEYNILTVTDKDNRKTKFYVSAKLFRVAWLEYEDGANKYTLRFFDFRFAQNTLVPYRLELFGNNKKLEETTISTITFGQKVDESLFQDS